MEPKLGVVVDNSRQSALQRHGMSRMPHNVEMRDWQDWRD